MKLSKNEKQMIALLAIAIIIILLLWLNTRAKAIRNIANSELEIPEMVFPNFNVWTWNVPAYVPALGEIYYSNGSCMCQG